MLKNVKIKNMDIRSIKKILSVNRAKLFALLYITNPLVISWLAFDGQDESLMIFAFGGLFYAISHSSRFFNSFFSSFSLFAVKITALAAVLPVLMVSSRKETLGVLSLYPDWRWGKFNNINPYSSLKVFKQTAFNDWSSVINELYSELKSKINNR